jgi:hypothetical protein
MKVHGVTLNNQKAQLELTVRSGKVFPVPYAKLDPRPTANDRIREVYVDKELPEGHQGTMDLAEEAREEPDQEGVLQLEHVGVEAAVALSMSLGVEKERPPLAGLRDLGAADEPEERSRGFLEPLVRVDDVVDRRASVVVVPLGDGSSPLPDECHVRLPREDSNRRPTRGVHFKGPTRRLCQPKRNVEEGCRALQIPVDHPCKVVHRAEHPLAGRPADRHIRHFALLVADRMLGHAEGREHVAHHPTEPGKERVELARGDQDWEQRPLAHEERELRGTGKEQVRVPIAEPGRRRDRCRGERCFEARQEFRGAAQGEHVVLVPRAKPTARAAALKSRGPSHFTRS